MPETAKRTARVPILGEDGRISDDYIPAAIGENVTKAEAAATRAETAATAAESAKTDAEAAKTGAESFATNAVAQAQAAKESADGARGSASQAASSASAAKSSEDAAAESATEAQTSASQAQQSATAAAQSAASVADKFISSAQATTLEPGSQATASVENQVLTVGIPKGEKGDKGDTGEKGDPGTTPTVVAAEGSDISVSTDEGTVTIDDSALRERISELENQAANVVTGTATGLVSHAEDAYASKPREVRVKGRTVKNLWPEINATKGGITVSTDDTGLITVTGTTTTMVDISVPLEIQSLRGSVTIKQSKSFDGYCLLVTGSATLNIAVSTSANLTATGTIHDDATRLNAIVRVSADTTVNASFRVMLVEGTEVPDCFTPPASITSVQPEKMVTSGKNFLRLLPDLAPKTSAGVTFTPQADGGILVSGTATSTVFYNIDFVTTTTTTAATTTTRPSLNGQTVTCSLAGATKVNLTVGVFLDGMSIIDAICATNSKHTGVIPSTARALRSYLYVTIGTTVDGEVVYPQLELGSTATTYEPPTVTETALPEMDPLMDGDELVIAQDGTASVSRGDGTTDALGTVDLPALPAPTFNLYPTGGYVPGETGVEYVRDINLVLANLEAVQAALLGGE